MSHPSTQVRKKAMIQALTDSLGIVSNACRAVGIDRGTHYIWLKEDPEYKADVEDISEVAIDFAESKLHEKMNGVTIGKFTPDGELTTYEQPPSDTALIFYLKTKGKKRGYVERSEVVQTNTSLEQLLSNDDDDE